jgi:hypothetical protein
MLVKDKIYTHTHKFHDLLLDSKTYLRSCKHACEKLHVQTLTALHFQEHYTPWTDHSALELGSEHPARVSDTNLGCGPPTQEREQLKNK